ncbi:MAG: 5-formyltetrahydrofolate cyclo-ligase [Xanthobacteraceae bacterium]
MTYFFGSDDSHRTRDLKRHLRRVALARRDALPAEHRAAAAAAIAAQPLPLPIEPGNVVCGYAAIRSELDPIPLMRRLVKAGARLALPAVGGRGRPLALRAWEFGMPLNPGPWGLSEPTPDAPAVVPDIVLVPLAAFDRTGHRIGYGAGYYDLTLAELRAAGPIIAIGLAFAAQEIPKVPASERDAPLDLVVTEQEVIDLR